MIGHRLLTLLIKEAYLTPFNFSITSCLFLLKIYLHTYMMCNTFDVQFYFVQNNAKLYFEKWKTC